MPITRIITELDTSDTTSINFVKNLILADGGKPKVVPEEDGTVSVVGVFQQDPPELVLPAAGAPAAWMEIARKELGQKEVPGEGDNPRIREYHAATDGGAAPDSVPWCSSFVNWCLREAGIQGTGSKAARSWSTWGREIADFEPGCIVVLSRGPDPSKGHVGFYVGDDGGMIQLLGGNQSNAVAIASHDANRLITRRMPA